MQHILYVTDSLMAGGVERQVTALITGLDPDRFNPSIICLYGDKVGLRTHFAAEIQASGISVDNLNLGRSPADKVVGSIKLLKRIRSLQPDVVHAFNYHSNLLLRLVRPLFPSKTQLIGSVRGNYSLKQLRYEWLSHRSCAYITTNGPHLRQQLIDKAKIPSRKILYIPNGVDVDRFAGFDDLAARERIAPGASRLFVSIGRISHEKMMHYLPQALGILQTTGRLPVTTRLIIVGAPGSPEMHSLLDNAIAQYALETIVQYHPETHDLEQYYHACDATILFSPAEGMPNVVLESLASSRPVIVSEGANAAEIILNEKTGWIVPTSDVSQLAETIYRVINYPPDRLMAMGAACLLRAREYSMPAMVSTYEALYERIGKGTQPSA